MAFQSFPDIDDVQHWYVTTKDGLKGLKAAVNVSTFAMSLDTLDELFGMTESEWRAFYQKQANRHEMFATLALFAACEGGIRRDFEWRCTGSGNPMHQ